MELAIAAVSAAGVTVTVAVCMFVLGRRAADAERRAGEQSVRATASDAKALAAVQSANTWKAKATEEEARNAELSKVLDDAIAELPTDGARDRVRARWAQAHRTTTAAPDPGVPVPAGPDPAGPDALIDPFAE